MSNKHYFPEVINSSEVEIFKKWNGFWGTRLKDIQFYNRPSVCLFFPLASTVQLLQSQSAARKYLLDKLSETLRSLCFKAAGVYVYFFKQFFDFW